ncbi:YIP1 family protein [Leptospira gomenensis]|uniref:YIP1 family protein n=1 Tax=Leptospira gomenensis TaxID=2484974 RepID=A0A5F1YES6_9LEPT|nr:Yip1 family protein [Leptospira gomenensis]TGK32577.1 YIP1 family protein [Leptospira gomenensis]TGK38308.1 YIP1 family protein [Leptospira gomenensis]TGK52122.1 YIP1 family protein [Leptospira gomenensis]TGK59829.1 YIP1 family protein [Leptospira gomenensis]
MSDFSYSFPNVMNEAKDVLLKPRTFFHSLSKTKLPLIQLYYRAVTYLALLYLSAVAGMTLFSPRSDFSAPPASFLFFEMPVAYFLSSFIVFPAIGFVYMFFSWVCGGILNWNRNFRAATATMGILWMVVILQSFGGLIHFYIGLALAVLFTAYFPYLFFLALTSYLEAPLKRTAILLSLFTLLLLYAQYSRLSAFLEDYKLMETMDSQKPLSREEEEQGEKAAEEIIRRAMEKAKSEGHQTQ